MTKLYLLRHAASQALKDQPEPVWPLTDEGLDQADALIDRLVPLGISRICSSPYLRAQKTAAPFARTAGLSIEVVEDLRERRGGGYVASLEELFEIMERLWNNPEERWRAAETGVETTRRVRGAIEGIAKEGDGETVLISSHGQAIALFLKSINPDLPFSFWREMKNPDLFEVTWDGEGFSWVK